MQAKVLVPQTRSGTYEIADVCNNPTSFGSSRLIARCDMETDGGKWLVIQRRINGSVNFYRNWTDYVKGFGNLEGEFWYGLDKIHCLTTRDDVELRIELGNGTEPTEVWTYQLFRVGGADTNYTLTMDRPGEWEVQMMQWQITMGDLSALEIMTMMLGWNTTVLKHMEEPGGTIAA